ncbi:flagellar motor switch protein FliM [Tissierella sp. Yu-01]|uniref:flagellar motor switch protein FliM n=1 Tax=Tissierella sp. Yu-01 TaxID=3035694 RepID=UPI00240D7808|nr:flagellar motor switch protein FliM [Tissierella sp. Yu-01]WFA07930.1 flagellar motor switch protein FliM [Tissierella sp. Yu-01]
MNQVLSQQEIDSLLNALHSGEIDPNTIKEEEEKNKVKSYDFRRPIKLSKEYINTLYMIFENFSKMAGNAVSNLIHSNVDIKIGAIEQVSFDEFIHSIPNPTVMGLFHSKLLKGSQFIEINPQFCVQVIELMCGGAESSYTKNLKKKDTFTDIELGILEETILTFLRAFKAAWSEVVELETELDDIQTNPQLVQSMSPNEPIILISLILELFENKTFMNICIPYMSFEDITDKLSMKNWFDFEKEGNQDYKEVLTKKIESLVVDLEVDLGETFMTVDDFLQIEVGDIIQLNRKINDPLKMYVEDKLHYFVRPGEVDDKIAVEVLQYIEEDVE